MARVMKYFLFMILTVFMAMPVRAAQSSSESLNVAVTTAPPEWKNAAKIGHIQIYPQLFERADVNSIIYQHLTILKKYGYNTVGICGYHYRFDWIDSWDDIENQIAVVCANAKRVGIKVVDHHSAVAARPVNFGKKTGIGQYTIGDLAPFDCRIGKTAVGGNDANGTVFLCVNNPLVIEAYKRHLKGIIEAGVDAIMSDDMTMYRDVYSCACKYCKEKFQEQYKIALPPASDKTFWENYENADFRKWCQFRSDSVAAFVGQVAKYIEANSGGKKIELLTCNAVPVGTYFNVGRAINLEKMTNAGLTVNYLEPYDSATYYDYFPNWRNHAIDIMVMQNAGKRLNVPVWIGWYVSGAGKGLNYVFDPACDKPQSDLCKVQVHGTSEMVGEPNPAQRDQAMFMFGMGQCFGGNEWLCWAYNHMTEAFSFQNKYPGLNQRDGDFANVGLIYSSQTRDNYMGGSDDGYVNCFRAWAQLLVDRNIQFDIVDDHDMAGDLSRFKLLIAANTACLSENQCKNIEAFVDNGGTFVATFGTSLYNEAGERLANFGLSNVLGVQYLGQVPQISAGRLSSDLEKASILTTVALRGPFIQVKTKTKPLVSKQEPNETALPIISLNKFGKGKAIYCSLRPETFAYVRPHRQVELNTDAKLDTYTGKAQWVGCEDEQYRDFMAAMLNLAHVDERITTKQKVDGLIWRVERISKDCLVIHSLNMTGAKYASGEIYSFPLTTKFSKIAEPQIDFVVKDKNLHVKRAVLLCPDMTEPMSLKLESQNRLVRFGVPSSALHRYAAIVLELSQDENVRK